MNKKVKELKLKILMKDLEILRNEYYSNIEKLETIKLLVIEESNLNQKVEEPEHEEPKEEPKEEVKEEPTENKEDSKEEPVEDMPAEITEEGEKTDKSENADIKKIYRQLVLKTHPDRNKNLEKIKRDELTNIYKEAVESYNGNNFFNIIYLAYKIGIDISDISEKRFKDIEEYKNNLENKIRSMEYDTLMVWYNATDPHLKDIMFQRLLRQLKITIKK
jgi:hypothetical protein